MPVFASTQLQNRLHFVSRPIVDDTAEFARQVREGLTAEPKRLSSRFIYDADGSELFERICDQPEYYLTRAETEILEIQGAEIVKELGPDTVYVELGSGNSRKTRILIEAALSAYGRCHYVPIDVSMEILLASAREMVADHGTLTVTAVHAEYTEGLRYIEDHLSGGKCVMWLGSSIGNFCRPSAREFLGKLCALMEDGDSLLLGGDLRKDRRILEAAYDDAEGVTAAFNRNLLQRINREFNGDFDPRRFKYLAEYDADAGCVNMFQVSTADQTVRIAGLDLEVAFRAGERMHTEYSHKYSPEDLDRLAAEADLRTVDRWYDSQRNFSLSLMLPVGRPGAAEDHSRNGRGDPRRADDHHACIDGAVDDASMKKR